MTSTLSWLVYGFSGTSIDGASARSGASVGLGLPATTPTCVTNPPKPFTTEEMNGPTWPLPTHRIAPPSITMDRARKAFIASGSPRRRSMRR